MRSQSAVRRLLAVSVAAALAVGFLPGRAQAEPTVPHAGQGAIADPDHALGGRWRSSSDVVVTGAGDADGYHLYIAREKDAFGWQTLATLKSTDIDVGPWGGSVCVTGSGRYAVVVFAPVKASNDPKLMMAGALAAVVDTTTGKATAVAAGVQFSYFNPACGPGDRALLTRAVGADTQAGRSTDLLTVDAAAGKVSGTRHVAAQLTTPAAAPDGDYGIVAGQLVKVAASGSVSALGRPQGRPFAVRATAGGGIDVVSADGETAVAQRFGGGRFTTTATGPRNRVQLFGLRGGRNVLVGQVRKAAGLPSDLTTLAEDQQVDTVSGEGHLIVQEALTSQAAAAAAQPLTAVDPGAAGQVQFKVRAVAGHVDSTAQVDTAAAATLDVDLAAFAPGKAERPGASLAAATASPCMIRRNDPTVQPLQPSPNQVEWAVDNAVHGTLTASRPANYLKSGQPAYSPQGMFPLDSARRGDGSVSGAGRVPANLELAILAQETNLSQASWHAVPGDTGNPLIASYYGTYDINTIDYDKADCGYGIGQVTTGMSSNDNPLDRFTHPQQVAVAVDYEANIAASVNILVSKWNQLHAEPDPYKDTLNNDNADYIENWFLALWAYNSGLHTYDQRNLPDSGGHFGLGWLNNPANPDYSAGRDGFLRDTLADAETPNRWSYPERIMGWVETPQNKGGQFSQAYKYPAFGSNPNIFFRNLVPHYGVTLPGLYDFCDTQFGCSQANNGCPAVNSSCWWHGHMDFADCTAGRCTTENLQYLPGSGSEPGVVRTYPTGCTPFDATAVTGRDPNVQINMVYRLRDTGQYNLGCAIPTNTLGGKFLLRGGSPAGQDGAPYADIDLHQLGAGYLGHMWFTHGASGSALAKHKVVGAWEPELPLLPGQSKTYTIWAHQPSHGGTWASAVYNIQKVANNKALYNSPVIDQGPEADGALGSDHWVNLGTYVLGRGARVLLSNDGAPAGADVAYDAMAFVPMA
ncbi:hypothetical protein AB0M46_11395 [Dactylosporangium sp. NPDC051485]|uniref:hypothetical protein n=1 Tax=Dactylosporangium sp. NPDC051485 TaxID=3154846 RepID=UPI00341F3A36